MGFRTIDLDTREGREKYKKLKETKSIKETFGNEGIEKFAPRPEVKEDDNEKIQNVPEKEPEVKEEPAKVENNTPKITVQGVVTGVSQLRVRIKPEGDIQYLISEKSVVKILDEMEGWYKVETAPGRTGWVMKSYIKVYTEGG